MRGDKRTSFKSEAKGTVRGHKRGVTGYSRKTALLEEAITQMNAGKYGRSSSALKELLALDPQNMEARRLFATLHLRLGSLIPARQAFDTLITEAFQRQDYWLAESLLREYLAAGPRCVPFLEKLGVIYQEKGDVQEAIAEYGKAIDILIEDPDPDNPDLVSQLYKKVRELAPASPIAIRLASSFDAQTGELIARGPSSLAPAAEPLDTTSDHHAIPEPASGVMPWDIDTPQGDCPDLGETIASPDGSSPFTPTHAHEALLKAVTARGQVEPSDHVQMQAQPDPSLGEQVPTQSQELTHHDHGSGVFLVHEEHRVQVSSGDAQTGVLSSALPAAAHTELLDPSATGSEDCSPAALGAVEPTQQPAEIALVCTGESSVDQQTTNDQSSVVGDLTVLMQATESAGGLQSQVVRAVLPDVTSTVSDPAVGAHTETVRDMPVAGVEGHVLPQSQAEPWKEPGFSWENLFDRAWNFGTLSSAESGLQDATPSMSEAPPIADSSPQQSSPIESESVQIPERVENTAVMEEVTSTGSVRPLPWDQIQESALPIPPAQVEEVHGTGAATAEAQASLTGVDKPPIESATVEISERTDREAIAPQLTDTGSVRPLPWDQVQESALPIPPPSVEDFHGEGAATTAGHASPIGGDTAPMESVTVEIPERTNRDVSALELTDTGSVRPLPWDQIQESVLSIPLAQAEEFQGEGAATTEEQSGASVQDKSKSEHESVTIAERVAHDAVAVELTATVPVSLVPWDQIQESALPILQAPVEEFHTEDAAATAGRVGSHGQDEPPIESVTVEIPEQTDRVALTAELTSTGSVKPLPWDQIQESALPIPPAPVDEFQGESVVATEGQSVAVGEDNPAIESASVEIPEQADRVALAAELTDTGSVRPLPWDQVQESALPIPPPSVEDFHGEGAATTEGQSAALGEHTASIASVAGELPESVGQDPVEGLTATDPISLACDKIEESILPVPTTPIEELHAGEKATTEEQAASTVRAAEVADLGHDHSSTVEVLASASEEAESLSEGTSSGISLLSESDVHSVLVHHSEQETVHPEICPAVPITASQADQECPVAGEVGSMLPSAVAQTDELDQSVRLQVQDAPVGEPELAIPHSPSTREEGAGPISGSDSPPECWPSSTGGSAPEETLRAALASQVEEKRGEREEGTVVSQDVTTEEDATTSSLSPESPRAVPPWQIQAPVTAPSVEREMIAATPVETFSFSSRSESVATVQSHDDLRQDDPILTETVHKSSESPIPQEEWAKTSESIRFVEASPEASAVTAETEQEGVAPAIGMVADDTRFRSSRNAERDASREQEVEAPSRPKVHSERRGVSVAIQDCIGSCFSTTRAIVATGVGLVLLSVIAVAAGIGIIGLTWFSMEEGPSPAYQSFTTIPQQTLSDVKKNGYFLLVGFDASSQLDPIQAGYEGKIGTDQVATGRACLGDTQGAPGQQSNASASVSKGWFRSTDPVGQFKSHADTVRGWASQQSSALSRYGRWHTLPFEDWGYGHTGGLPCASIVFAHELYLADGFLQAMEEGVGRLETDMEAWRIVLGQARTLPVKALALQAMNDDITVASGLLVRADFDSKYLGRLSKILRPLDPAELSIRWPMQSELVVASKTYEAQVKAAKAGDQSVYATIASMLSLPKQRRLNDYAEYYEVSYKAVGEGHHSALPKRKDYIRTPAAGLSDYLTNPIENIVGLEPLPPWDLYHGEVMDTEARLRLASLQAWLRRGPADGDVLTRLAKAGQKFYDPYTGLPMLVNMKKAALYSVGHDGKDQDADPQFDVVVTLPAVHTSSAQASSKSPAASSKP